ncbi:hypothetical protein NPIL_412391 [Nephila pilipes]|uniref:Uncharacterized protein n=1 Tax=Nephila pilipes TaxID=299642 RepID=A0A8X6N6Y5_NEPPI|nr:hypothetical protein NPIL_412391 [Nephila pilipes]
MNRENRKKKVLLQKELGSRRNQGRMKDLIKRFRLEYLGALIPQVKPDDAVFSECVNPKRVYWMLRKATEVPPETNFPDLFE